MMMLFKSWDKIVAEHKELKNMMAKKYELSNTHVKEWNSKKSPLIRREKILREKLLTCTTRERDDIEKEIDIIVDELKLLEEKLDAIAKEEQEITEIIYSYMRKNLTEKELKKAKKHGWKV